MESSSLPAASALPGIVLLLLRFPLLFVLEIGRRVVPGLTGVGNGAISIGGIAGCTRTRPTESDTDPDFAARCNRPV